MNKKPVYYNQADPKWGKIPYTIDADKDTIATSGCGPTSMAMVLATLVDAKITPKETCALAIQLHDRTANSGTEWEYFKHVADKYKLKFCQLGGGDIGNVIAALNAGKYVIASMGPGLFTKSGHFILLWGMNNGQISVLDPGHLALCKDHPLDVFKKQAKQYFVFNK